MAVKNFRGIVIHQAATLEKAVNCLIPTFGNTGWLGKLKGAAEDIRCNGSSNDWVVNIEDMELPIDNPKHLEPHTLNNNLKLFVSISMEGSGELWKEGKDCIKSLRFTVRVKEKYQKDDQHSFQTGFHIDKVGKKDDSSEMHPLYHVHFLNESCIDGIMPLSMDVPRLMHHPVDALLGLLLVFANYHKDGYKKLTSNGNFMSLCRESAKHILVPYYTSLSKVPWTEGFVSEYDKSLCPYLTA